MRARWCHRFGIAWLVASMAAPMAAGAQMTSVSPDRSTYFVVLRGDTILVDRVARTPGRIDGALLDRHAAARFDYTIERAADGNVSHVSIALFARTADTSAYATWQATFTGDSAIIVATSDGRAHTTRVAAKSGTMPWLNFSPAFVEAIAQRARAAGDSSQLQILDIRSATSLPATVKWATRDSAVMLLGTVFTMHMDANGRLDRVNVPVQGLKTTRVDGDRAMAPIAIDYSAPPGAPYTAQSITLRTKDGLTLAGTLTLPNGASTHRVPAVVTITGSGTEERDESIPGVDGYRPFRELADSLGRRGIAVLRLDDRGAGGSETGPSGATSADFARDIESALNYLRTRSDIDATRLALVGHSEGGIIAPMVAARDTTLRAIVLMAGPALSGRAILDYQLKNAIARNPSLSARMRDSLLTRVPAQIDTMAANDGWMKFFVDYDPLPTARKVRRAHVLILQGETDQQVTPMQAPMLERAFRAGGNRNVTLLTFPATDHLFLADPSGNPAGYATLPDHHVRPEVLSAIGDFLSRAFGIVTSKPPRT